MEFFIANVNTRMPAQATILNSSIFEKGQKSFGYIRYAFGFPEFPEDTIKIETSGVLPKYLLPSAPTDNCLKHLNYLEKQSPVIKDSSLNLADGNDIGVEFTLQLTDW